MIYIYLVVDGSVTLSTTDTLVGCADEVMVDIVFAVDGGAGRPVAVAGVVAEGADVVIAVLSGCCDFIVCIALMASTSEIGLIPAVAPEVFVVAVVVVVVVC